MLTTTAKVTWSSDMVSVHSFHTGLIVGLAVSIVSVVINFGMRCCSSWCRIGLDKIRLKFLQSSVDLWQLFLGHFFFTKPRTWMNVCFSDLFYPISISSHLLSIIYVPTISRVSFIGSSQSIPMYTHEHTKDDRFDEYNPEDIPLKRQDSMR